MEAIIEDEVLEIILRPVMVPPIYKEFTVVRLEPEMVKGIFKPMIVGLTEVNTCAFEFKANKTPKTVIKTFFITLKLLLKLTIKFYSSPNKTNAPQ